MRCSIASVGENGASGYDFLRKLLLAPPAVPVLNAAHRRRAASAMALRPAALSRRFLPAGIAAVAVTAPSAEIGAARPLRWLGSRRAAIALDRRSRSAISKETICSVCMTWRVAFRAHFVQGSGFSDSLAQHFLNVSSVTTTKSQVSLTSTQTNENGVKPVPQPPYVLHIPSGHRRWPRRLGSSRPLQLPVGDRSDRIVLCAGAV